MKKLRQANIKNKRVIIRVDFNVPMKNQKITNDMRIKKSLDTINYVLKKGASQVILISHLGRPKAVDPQYSLEPIAKRLSQLLKRKVALAQDFFSVPDKIVVYENLRFFEGEKKNSPTFAKKIAALGDIYINDAFGTAHRKHASNNAITRYLPSYPGLLLEQEITQLSKVLKPKRPLVTIIGFAKIADKLQILKQLLAVSDKVLVGGAIVFTFAKTLGIPTGKSLVDESSLTIAKKLYNRYKDKLIFPLDIVAAKTPKGLSKIVDYDKIPSTHAGFDVGPKTLTLWKKHLREANTIFWNGPVGLFEIKPYDKATNSLARYISKLETTSIVGGGDTVTAIQKSRAKNFSHLSTGGGASIAFFDKKPLPAIQALYKSSKKTFKS